MAGACGKSDYCCYPICDFGTDPGCHNPCGSIRNGVIGSQTISFLAEPGKYGALEAHGAPYSGGSFQNLGTVLGFSQRASDMSFFLGNMYSDQPCNELKTQRAYIMFDTNCLNASQNIASASFKSSAWTGYAGGFQMKTGIYVDQSTYPDSSNNWILNPATFDTATRGIQGTRILSDTSVPNSVSVPTNLVRRENKTRFVFIVDNIQHDAGGYNYQFNPEGTSEFRLGATSLPECQDYLWGKIACGGSSGTMGNSICAYKGNGNLHCGVADPCMTGSNLQPGCWGANPPSNVFTCERIWWSALIQNSYGPKLEVTLCNPGYFNNCDYTNSCSGTRTTSPYNSCDLLTDVACGQETSCTSGNCCADGKDNNCNGLTDCDDPTCASDPKCPQEENITNGNCANTIDDDFNNECDYDTSSYDPVTCTHGDHGCPVTIQAITVNTTNPCPNGKLIVNCTASVSGVNSVDAWFDNVKCDWIPGSWHGNTGSFLCPASGSGQQIARCTINTTRSYQNSTDMLTTVTVGGCPNC